MGAEWTRKQRDEKEEWGETRSYITKKHNVLFKEKIIVLFLFSAEIKKI